MSEHNLAQRLNNLSSNYARYDGEEEELHTDGPFRIVRHRRGMGRIAHYAVIDDIPVAYCTGYDAKRPNRQRFIITSTFVHPDYRKKGIAAAIYRAIIDDGITLVSDWELSEGAKALWAHLQRSEPMRDIISFREGYVAHRRSSRMTSETM